MADVHTPVVRSYNMSQVRSKDTKPELLVRRWLHANGFRFRLHDSKLPGKPDIVLPKYQTIIFVHGCFWHGHEGCKYATIPETRRDWWANKIQTTNRKDHQNAQKLREDGWHVVNIFQCELRPAQRQRTLENLLFYLKAPSFDSVNFKQNIH